ncbi:MotE family protein [Paenibacillus donghaensis]|uniref:MotE family protein n=1 Tax=Paenibacillus donghaensis TaxID=414771 RepID=UPI002AD32660|nr:kinesin [Paenibacillus donghaensis]
MADKDFEIDQESAGRFERFLFFMIPIIFTIVLIGVLLTLFNVNIRNDVLGVAQKIPIVKNWVPEPTKDPAKKKLDDTKDQVKSAEATIKELKNQLAAKDKDLEQAKQAKTEQDQKLKNMQEQIDSIQNSQTEAAGQGAGAQEADPYDKQIKDLAKMYANMSPSKAAPIMQNLTTEEMVQLLSAMKNDNRTAILAKMDPKIAADVTMKLKDAVSSSDLAVAALQSRVHKDAADGKSGASSGLDKSQISQTFASMPADSAAALLLSTYKISPDKVLKILNDVTDSTRSGILDAMSKKDAKTAAVILNKLMNK